MVLPSWRPGRVAFLIGRPDPRPQASADPAGADQAGFVSLNDQLRAVPGAELGHGPGRVGLRRGDAHVEPGRDLLVGQTARDQDDHLTLACSQRVHTGYVPGLAA